MNTQKATIGSILHTKRVPENININLFPQYQKIVAEIIMGDVDTLSLMEKFGNSEIAEMVLAGIELTSPEKGIEILRREDLKRKIKAISSQAIKDADTENPQEVAAKLAIEALSINEVHASEKNDVESIAEELEQQMLENAEMRQQGKMTIGIPTGYKIIDKEISGLRPEHLIAISAYTNVGKTTLAMNIVNNILGNRIVIISLEMSKIDMLAKLVAINQDMVINEVYEAGTNDAAYATYKKAKENIKNIKMYTDKTSIDEILMIMRSEEEREHVDVFVIDYIQNIVGRPGESEYETMTRATRDLQALTKKLKTTTIVLSQISNESRKSNELSVNGKGSGAIRAACDMFLYLNYEDTEDESVMRKIQNNEPMNMKIFINKNRHGKLGSENITRNPYSGKMYGRTNV